MSRFSEKGYFVRENAPVYFTKNMDNTVKWFEDILGWYSNIVERDEQGNGRPTTTTITPAKAEGIQWIAFCTGYGTRTERIQLCKDACVCFNSPKYHISLKGSMEIITDADVKKEMWYEGMGKHFDGPEDSGYMVLKFVADSYNLFIDWQSAKGNI